MPRRSPAPSAAHRADRASYFEALSANINRGWPPLRGAVAGKYIQLPVPGSTTSWTSRRDTQLPADRHRSTERGPPHARAVQGHAAASTSSARRRRPGERGRRRLDRPCRRSQTARGSNNRSIARNSFTTRSDSPTQSSSTSRFFSRGPRPRTPRGTFVCWHTGQRDRYRGAGGRVEGAAGVNRASLAARRLSGRNGPDRTRSEPARKRGERRSGRPHRARRGLPQVGRTADAIEQWKHATAITRTAMRALCPSRHETRGWTNGRGAHMRPAIHRLGAGVAPTTSPACGRC